MNYFKITFDNCSKKILLHHHNRSQDMFCQIEEIAPAALHTNGIPLAIELDGWADDQACIGDTFETEEGFTVECITEQEFRETTWQEDVPTHLLENYWQS